jgi:hypothetical protein
LEGTVTPYLTFATWKARSRWGSDDCNDIYAREPDKVDNALADVTEWINARLRKRYDEAQLPTNRTILGWCRDIVDFEVFLFKGGNPSSMQDGLYKEKHDTAKAEILEAANAENGLFDLPLKQNVRDTGIAKGGPLVYSEASPYTWLDRQRDALRDGG